VVSTYSESDVKVSTDGVSLSLLYFFSARLSKNIKISTFEKASKSSHFRSDKQRQISLNLSHTCRNRKRLISLINFATLYVVRRQVCREYSMYSRGVSLYSRGVSLYSRSVFMYSKRCLFILTLKEMLMTLTKIILFENICNNFCSNLASFNRVYINF
jgi:hypothetical protein